VKKILSFLGTGNYSPVVYEWSDSSKESKQVKTHLFPYALAQYFSDYRVIIFVTQKAKEAGKKDQEPYLQQLEEKLKERLIPVTIPEGRNPEELWQIFNILVENVSQEDEIILDITHAFRSIPMFSLVASSFLRQVKRAQIKHILYGAYEAREKRDGQEIAPVFDLSLILDLMDWISATDFFLSRGDAKNLAYILRRTHSNLWKKKHSLSASNLPKLLSKVGKNLESFSLALWLAQPCEVMKSAKKLEKVLSQAKNEFEEWALPFATILGELQDQVSKLASQQPDYLNEDNLCVQKEIISYLIDKGLYMQAVSMAREWVISWIIFKSGQNDLINRWKNREAREEIARMLGKTAILKRRKDQSRGEKDNNIPEWFKPLEKKFDLGKLWNWLANLRNEIDHCGMREHSQDLNSLKNQVEEISNKIKDLT